MNALPLAQLTHTYTRSGVRGETGTLAQANVRLEKVLFAVQSAAFVLTGRPWASDSQILFLLILP